MKKILAFFLIPFCLSCSIEYDGGTRYIVTSAVVDTDGLPLNDVLIEIGVHSGGYSDIVSYNNTDGNGLSVQMFPPPEDNDDTFSITINPQGGVYQSKELYNIGKLDFVAYMFDLGEVVLLKNDEITTFTILLENVNPQKRLTKLYIDATTPAESVDYNPVENPYIETFYRILKNQNFTLYYEVTDFSSFPATVTEYSVPLAVANEPLSYLINY